MDARYRQVEQQLTVGQTVDGVDEFKAIVDEFRTTSQRRLQQDAAISAENWLNAHATALNDAEIETSSVSPPDLAAALVELNDSHAREQAILRSPGGLLLDLVLEFQQPEEFQLAEW